MKFPGTSISRYTTAKRFTVLMVGVVAILSANILLEVNIDSIPNITYTSRLFIFVLLLPVAYVFGLILEALGSVVLELVLGILHGEYRYRMVLFLKNISALAHGDKLATLDPESSKKYAEELSVDDAVAEHEVLLTRVRSFQYRDLFLKSALGFSVYLGLFLTSKFFLLAFIMLLFVLHNTTRYTVFRQELRGLLTTKK